jgi:hypothetical protein
MRFGPFCLRSIYRKDRLIPGPALARHGGKHTPRRAAADADTSLETLALVSSCRVPVEEYFGDVKSHLGMAEYEARGWSSWHHHMRLVALARLLVTLTRLDLKKNERLNNGPSAPSAASRPFASQLDGTRRSGDHRLPLAPKSNRSEVARKNVVQENHKTVRFKVLL